jgi:dTDP-4-amino-4,6-dideoxygalactose transaminase
MTVPLLDLSPQHEPLWPELRDAFEQVAQSGQYILGPFVEKFEKELATYCGVDHAIGISSGTDALLVAMMAMDIGPGDEVITSPFTFFATGGAIARLGVKPVFVDIFPSTYNMKVQDIAGAITAKTKAIMPVHLFGLTAHMDPIMDIAREHGLGVIEDAAQAIGAKHNGHMAGSIGTVGCLSFFPSKNLGTLGDAGACVTNDESLAKRIRSLRVHGTSDGLQYPHVGGNFRLDALQAAMLSVKLPHLDGWIQQRRDHADRYGEQLEELPVGTPFEARQRHHIYNQYTIRVHGQARDGLLRHLQRSEIGCRVYYPVPLHLQPCFASLGYERGSFPHSEEAAEDVLSLPVFPELTSLQQDQVIESLRDFFTSE